MLAIHHCVCLLDEFRLLGGVVFDTMLSIFSFVAFRIVSAGFMLYSANNTRQEVYAVTTQERDIYSFNIRNQTQTAHEVVDQSLYFPLTLG